MIAPADNTAARAPPEPALVEAFAAIAADIDSTILHWLGLGLTAENIAIDLQCRPRWPQIRAQMIAIAIGSRRIKLPRSEIVTLVVMRRRRSLTQAYVADRLGLSRIAFHDYERGNTRPTELILASWKHALAATPLIGA